MGVQLAVTSTLLEPCVIVSCCSCAGEDHDFGSRYLAARAREAGVDVQLTVTEALQASALACLLAYLLALQTLHAAQLCRRGPRLWQQVPCSKGTRGRRGRSADGH